MELRASDQDREQTAARLRTAAGEGRLDPDELEARVAAAFAARTVAELRALTLDLPAPAAPPTAASPTVARSRRERHGALLVAGPLVPLAVGLAIWGLAAVGAARLSWLLVFAVAGALRHRFHDADDDERDRRGRRARRGTA
jgi:hypothetical protein